MPSSGSHSEAEELKKQEMLAGTCMSLLRELHNGSPINIFGFFSGASAALMLMILTNTKIAKIEAKVKVKHPDLELD